MNLIFLFSMVLYLMMYLISFHVVMNGDDWFVIWLGLEINMIMFIMLIYKRYDMMMSESCLKYFFIQSLGSGIFMSLFYLNVMNLKVVLSMMMSYSIAAGPFFFWLPSLCSSISWMSCFVLLSIQKIIPLFLMNLFISGEMFLVVVISLFVGIFGSFNQIELKGLLAFSSVFHLGWIILCNMTSDLYWVIYMMMYMLMLFPLIFFLDKMNMMNMMEVMKLKYKFLFCLLMLSMAGMPPLVGFYIKWFAFKVILNMSMYMIVLLVFSSVIMFYVYFRLLYDILLMGYSEGLWNSWNCKMNNLKLNLDMLSLMGLMSGSFMMMMMYL